MGRIQLTVKITDHVMAIAVLRVWRVYGRLGRIPEMAGTESLLIVDMSKSRILRWIYCSCSYIAVLVLSLFAVSGRRSNGSFPYILASWHCTSTIACGICLGTPSNAFTIASWHRNVPGQNHAQFMMEIAGKESTSLYIDQGLCGSW